MFKAETLHLANQHHRVPDDPLTLSVGLVSAWPNSLEGALDRRPVAGWMKSSSTSIHIVFKLPCLIFQCRLERLKGKLLENLWSDSLDNVGLVLVG